VPAKAGHPDFVQLNGKPYSVLAYTSKSTELLPDSMRSGPITYADRKGEDTVAQATWHKGFGRGEIRAAQTYVRSADVADIGRYHYSQNVDARFRGQLILGPLRSTDTISTNAEAKVQFIEFNGVMLAIGARYVHSVSGTTWTSIKDMGASAAAVKGCAAIFGSKLYVADGNSIVLSYDGTTWANAITGMTTPILCATVGTTLWILSNLNQLQSTTDGSTLATAIACGSGKDKATALVDYNGFPHVAKPDGLFYYDGQNLWNVYPELDRRKKATNGQGAAVARATLFLPFGPQVVAYAADLIVPDAVNLLPDRIQGVEARGAFLDFWPDADHLWGLFKSQGGNYYITAYDFNPTPGQGWHQIAFLGTTATTAIGVQASLAAPILLFSQGTNILRFLLAQNGVNPYADTNYRYAATGDIYLSQEADDFDDVQKSYISVLMDTASLAAGITVAIKYAVDGAAEQTLTTLTTNGAQELFFPSGTTGKRLALHLSLATNDSTKTPQVFPVARRYKRRFTRVSEWTLDLDLARGNQNVTADALTQWTALIAAANTVDSVAFTDIDGQVYSAYVERVDDITDPEKMNDRTQKTARVTLVQRRNTAAAAQAAVSTYSTVARYS
jgi:hypothetical protein